MSESSECVTMGSEGCGTDLCCDRGRRPTLAALSSNLGTALPVSACELHLPRPWVPLRSLLKSRNTQRAWYLSATGPSITPYVWKILRLLKIHYRYECTYMSTIFITWRALCWRQVTENPLWASELLHAEWLRMNCLVMGILTLKRISQVPPAETFAGLVVNCSTPMVMVVVAAFNSRMHCNQPQHQD